MAVITLNPSVVTHTIPAAFWGLYAADYAFDTDMPNANYRALSRDLKMEIFRVAPFIARMTDTFYSTYADEFMAHLEKYSRPVKPSDVPAADWRPLNNGLSTGTMLLLQLSPHPNGSTLSTQSPTTYPGNIAADGTGHSANDMVTCLEQYIAAGLPPAAIYGCEYTNETALLGSTDPGAYPHYYALSYSYSPNNGQGAADDWITVHVPQFYAALNAKRQALGNNALGYPFRLVTGVLASAWSNNIDLYMKRHIQPEVAHGSYPAISPWPHSGTQTSRFDCYSFHPYPTGDGQNSRNCLFYPTADPNKSRTYAFARETRAFLDSVGAPNHTQFWSELAHYSLNGSPITAAMSGLWAAAALALACRAQAELKLDGLTFLELNRLGGTIIWGGGPSSSPPYAPTAYYYTLRDLVSRFSRLYKRQLLDTRSNYTTSVTGSGMTPGGSNANSVERIQVAAGLSADGATIGVLVCNIDSTTAEAVTINIGAASTGPVAGVFLAAGQGAVPLASIAPFGSAGATNFTRTIPALEAYLFEIPIAAGTPPPAPSGHLGNWSTAQLVNAGQILPPQPPTGHIGNWSVAQNVNAGPVLPIGPIQQFLPPRGISSQAGWKDQDGGNAVVPALVDISNANYAQSGQSPVSPDNLEVLLEAANDPLASTNHIARYRVSKTSPSGDTIQLTVRLMQGVVEIASWVHIVTSTTPTEFVQTLSPLQADAITNYVALSVKFEAVKI